MGLLPGVDQVVFLEVCQLREALLTQVALEGPLAAVDAEVDLAERNKHGGETGVSAVTTTVGGGGGGGG